MRVGRTGGISCQLLQVIMTHLPQKHWEWQEDRKNNVWHGSDKRPMYIASMDIKTAFDVARPKHIANIRRDHDTHGWITASLLREMGGLEGHATMEHVESKFKFRRWIRQRSVGAPTLWLKMAKHTLSDVEKEWKRKQMRIQIGKIKGEVAAAFCGSTTMGPCRTQKKWNI